MNNILICDDERDIVKAIRIYLSAEGYNCYEAYNGAEAIEILKKEDIKLCILDIMMPIKDGVTTIKEIREFSNIPVIFLTAKSEELDMINGLNEGADDYITKPFRPMELLARVRSVLRRYIILGGNFENKESEKYCVGGITLNNETKTVTVDGEYVQLTPREFEILMFLMKNPGQVFSMKEIFREVWIAEPFGAENAVAVHIRHIREKVEIDPAKPKYIKAVWGHGYKIEEV